MSQEKPTYEELETRLAQAEEALRAIRSGEIDAITGDQSSSIIRTKALEEALTESKERFELAISGSNAGFWYLQFSSEDPYKIPDKIYISPRLKEFIGFKEDEFPNSISAWHSRIHPDDLEMVRKIAQEYLEGRREIHEVEYRIYHKDGSIRWIYSRGKIKRDEHGVPKSWSGIDFDITEKKQTEETLDFERNQLLSMWESFDQAIYISDPHSYEVLFANQFLKQLLGKDPVGGLCYKEFQGLDHPCEFCTNDIILKLNGRPYRWEYHNPKLNRDYDITDRIIRWPHGRDVRFEIAIDITDRKKIERELRESEGRYRLVVENAGDVIAIFQDGFFQFINKRATEIMGYSHDEFISRPFLEFVHPEDREMLLDYYLKRIKGEEGIPKIYSFRVINKEGNVICAEINSVLIDYKGKPAILSFIRDITERKRMEAEMLSLQEQLRQAQRMEAIGRLAGGIAHDFNNILSVIKGSTQLSLLDLREGDPLYSNLKEIDRAVDRASALTRQLLAFSRKQIMEMKVIDLNYLIRNFEKMLRRILGEDIELLTYLSETIGRVKADTGQIEQVIMNIVINSRDAMPRGGKLTIETMNVELDEEYARRHIAVKPGSYVMLSISDTGVGMTKEVQERIFEPFFTTKEMGRGTGLGLSTVYGIVKQSGGNIWVYSEPSKGTTFKIYLPRVDEPVEKVREEKEMKEVPRGGETVLIIEDEESVRRLVVRLLKKQGYRVLEASDGGKAFMLCEEYKEPIHLILTDVVMSGMSGRQVAERLQRIHPEAKVLYMSGYTDNVILHHGILEEKLDFIQKPFTLEKLARKVREVLDKT